MSPKTDLQRADGIPPITIGGFVFHATGIDVVGTPDFADYDAAITFAFSAQKRSSWWLADLLRYGDARADWAERLAQVQSPTGLSEKRLKNIRAVGAIPADRRRVDTVEFSLHEAVAGLTPAEQDAWLERAEAEGLSLRDLQQGIKASKRATVIEGQAVLEGRYRVIYADPPWSYGDSEPSGSSAARHYPTMTYEQIAALPIEAHAMPNAVLFLWVPATLLYDENQAGIPGPFAVMKAWGFQPKTGRVWDKVDHNFGHYYSVRHEHLILGTRGHGQPDIPTPMRDSVVTERRGDVHSAKPEAFRRDIEAQWHGPYLELFGRALVDGWTVWGNDARLL